MNDDDMQMTALKSTGYIKNIITAEIPIDVEAKGKQSQQAQIYSRFLCFGNGSPKALYDKSDDFSKQKIVWKRIGSILRFCYDESGMFCLDSTCFATGDKLKFLTLLLNSPLGRYLLKDSPKTGTGDLLISVQALEPLLIPPITDLIINSFDQEYDTLTQMCFDDKIDYERKIYIQLCKLYCFDEAEIKYISTF